MCDLLVYLDVLNTFVPEDHLFSSQHAVFYHTRCKITRIFSCFLHSFLLYMILLCNRLPVSLYFLCQLFFFLGKLCLFKQIRPVLRSADHRLFASPFFNIGMMTGHQYLRYFFVMPHFRSGILRVFQQIILKAFEFGRYIVMEDSRNQSGYRIDHDHRRKFSPGQDIIPDGYIIGHDLLQHTFVNPFIMSA